MLTVILEKINSIVWGTPTLLLFVGSGIWFSCKLGWLQFTKLPAAFRAIKNDLKVKDQAESGKNLSTTGALLASLGAVMGPGNLIGVSSAILIGGAGAIFWMWVSALLGMTARYAESVLAVLHRRSAGKGNFGGPMYVMRDRGFRRTAAVFSAAGVFVSLTMANALPSGALGSALQEAYGLSPRITGSLLCVFACATIFGGGKRIAKVSGVLVPVVCLFFIGASLWVMVCHPSKLLSAFCSVFRGAFSLKAGLGGLLGTTIRYGMARGIYSNEAGMGTEPILAAATDEPSAHRQGLISMTGPFLDTVVFCTFTALVVLMAGEQSGATAASLVSAAFSEFLPGCGHYIVNATMTLLVLATLASWAFYGESCLAYFGDSRWMTRIYRIVYVLLPLVCAGANLGVVFILTDLSTAIMAIPNLIVCILCIREVRCAAEEGEISARGVDSGVKIAYNIDKMGRSVTRIATKDGSRIYEDPVCHQGND